ncbi:E3 ubiquitin-protein ligase MARCH5 [Dissostichus eleginoides]|uniref:E3 ubiquitin-protein ligase MARCH5 n=1 Tax=Dissostichus eleginoides TaxID=100907 RepID=A0AAD9EWF3_DISEL|nr:E3 ubiquitin-protein ligase MARCH5 [Dissostichus eleginoides]
MALAEETPEKPAGVLPATGGPRSDSGQSLRCGRGRGGLRVLVRRHVRSRHRHAEGSPCDGTGRPPLLADGPPDDPRAAGSGEDDPLGGLPGRYLPRVPADGLAAGDHLSVSRTLCGALVFPTIASLVGRLLFRKMPSNLQRTSLGGIAFVLIKGVMKDGAEDEDTEDSGNE